MQFETIEREIHIEASPEVVFDVVSSPEHLREWWPDEAEFPAVPGERGGSASGTSRGAVVGFSSRLSMPCQPGSSLSGGPTRRASPLSDRLPVTRQAVAKHLVVLDRVGLVHGTTAGREKQFRVDQAQLARAVAQLAEVGAAWDSRLARIKRIAERTQRETGK